MYHRFYLNHPGKAAGECCRLHSCHERHSRKHLIRTPFSSNILQHTYLSSYQTNVMISNDGTPRLTDVGLRACLVKVICGDRRPILPGWMFKAPEELQFQCEPISFVNTKAMDV